MMNIAVHSLFYCIVLMLSVFSFSITGVSIHCYLSVHTVCVYESMTVIWSCFKNNLSGISFIMYIKYSQVATFTYLF